MSELGDEDEERMSTYFYDLPGTTARRSQYIFPAQSGPNVLRIVSLPDMFAKAGFTPGAGSYLYSGVFVAVSKESRMGG